MGWGERGEEAYAQIIAFQILQKHLQSFINFKSHAHVGYLGFVVVHNEGSYTQFAHLIRSSQAVVTIT